MRCDICRKHVVERSVLLGDCLCDACLQWARALFDYFERNPWDL